MEKGNLKQKIIAIIVLSTCYFLLTTSVVSAGAIRKPPNNLGLVLYWPMNEGDGTIVGDASGNGNHGTLSGNPFVPSWVSGKLGKAILFGASQNGKASLNSLSTTNTHTVSFWIYLTGNCTNWGAIFSQDQTNGIYCYIQGAQNKITYFYANDHFNNTALALNRWYHVAVVNSGGSVTFYLNGASDGTTTSAPGYSANSVGSDSINEYLRGRLDELRVYRSRALSAAEVLSLYQSGTAKLALTDLSPGTLKNGLTGHWTFDGKDMVENVADVSGSGLPGYLTSFTSTTTVPGKVGQALKFDGTNDNVVTNSLTSNFLTATDGTISVWVRPTGSTVNVSTIDSIRNMPTAVSTSGLFELGIHRGNVTDLSEDKIWLYNSSTGSYVGVDYNVNEWAHITWVHTGGILYAYKNGELAGSVSSGNTTLSNNLLIGKNWCCNAATNHWRGDLDDVRTWNRALTASEIKQVYNIGAGQKVSTTKTPVGMLQSGLTGHWTFDGKDMVSNVADVSGNGRNGFFAGTGTISTTTAIGKIGQALNFNSGNNKYVSTVASNNLITATTGTISAWVRPTGAVPSCTTSGMYACQFALSNPAVLSVSGIAWGNNTTLGQNKIWAVNSTAIATHQVVGVDYNLGEWTHITWVHSGGTLSIYKNGEFIDSTTAGNTNDLTGAFIIGRGWTGVSNIMNGDVDDVRTWNRALTANEIKQVYNLGR